MSIQIGKYTAEGPYGNVDDLRKASGVYVILGRSSNAVNWNVVDVGESKDVHDRVSNHDRADDWKRQGHVTLHAAPIYANEAQRMQIEQDLRQQYNPPCGER